MNAAPRTVPRRSRPLLALGDALIFVMFAWTGRTSHNETTASVVPAVLGTAAPFLVAWFLVAAVLGLYRPSAAPPSLPAVLRRAALAWVVACPLGLLLRALVLHRAIPPTFAGITFGFNLVLLLGWRALVALLVARSSSGAPRGE